LTLELLTQKTSIILALSLLSFLVAILLTPIYTHYAYKHKWWKLPRSHSVTGEVLEVIAKLQIKRDVPLMAGMIVIVAVTLVTVVFNLDRAQTWLPLAGLIGGGIVGLIDDIINVRGKGGNVAGLRAPLKLALITAIALISAVFFYYKLGYNTIKFPYIGDIYFGWSMIPIFALAAVSTSNAVNITDGLDGLSSGLLVSAYTAFGVIAALQGNFGIAIFCFSVVGALLAYLWFNIPPARFFMGDVGSFSLGMALGVVAMLTDTLFLLPIICLLFVVEAGSTLSQMISKKLFKRKIFIASPLHHHLEAKGWPKTKVTMRLWVIGQVCSVVGIALALLGGYIQ